MAPTHFQGAQLNGQWLNFFASLSDPKARDEILRNIGLEIPSTYSPYKANKDAQVLGFNVPENSQVLVNAWAIGRDPSYWENPTSFSPERFLGSSLAFKGRDFEYIPFGAGRRICPGILLAIRMVTLMLASILQAFKWRLPEGTTPENMDMEEQFGLTLRKAVPLCVIPIFEEQLGA